jgi:UDP-2,4-diacetamido-2,4,6-trideoxy-beta-L-altropyranose hydrolase
MHCPTRVFMCGALTCLVVGKHMAAVSHMAIRVDASLQIGTGHVMRCLTLADALRERGTKCSFICRPHQGHMLDFIGRRGHNAISLPALMADSNSLFGTTEQVDWLGTDWMTDARDTERVLLGKSVDWLLVDHYELDARWEKSLRYACKSLMVIDDLADRPHDCDFLLDQNLGRLHSDYLGLLSPHAKVLVGPKYAILRPEFAKLRCQSLARRSARQFRYLLIALGGVDKDNVTGQILDMLNRCGLPPELIITAVMGSEAPWLKEVEKIAAQMQCRTRVLSGVSDMAQIMFESDLAIGAAGGTAWERCCMGLPSLMLVIAENQRAGAGALEQAGAGITFKNVVEMQSFIKNGFLLDVPNFMKKYSAASALVTDGSGIKHVIDLLECSYV